MSLSETKKQTAELLGVDESELDYITEESLAAASENAIEDIEEDVDAEGLAAASRWGVFCHNIQKPAGKDYIEYQKGPKGSDNYGCGNDWYTAKKTLARYISRQNSKCGNHWKYLVSNYRP